MKSLSQWNSQSDSKWGSLRVWAFDLDDTLSTHGVVPSEVLAMLERLQNLGHLVVMVTGRPATWAQPFAKVFPFDAIVAENGAAMCFWQNGKARRVAGEEPVLRFWTRSGYQDAQTFLQSSERELANAKKVKVESEVRARFPRMALASDQMFRFYDLAIDFAEAVNPPESLGSAEAVKKIFEAHGAVAKVSSIHVNGWWGTFDKYQGLQELFRKAQWTLGFETVVYFGDSPNDAPLFAAAPLSVGVANLKAFGDDHSWTRPTFISNLDSSRGVLESLNHYLGT